MMFKTPVMLNPDILELCISQLTPYESKIYLYLYLQCHKNRHDRGWSRITIKEISSACGISESTVRKSLRRLDILDMITITATMNEDGGCAENEYGIIGLIA